MCVSVCVCVFDIPKNISSGLKKTATSLMVGQSNNKNQSCLKNDITCLPRLCKDFAVLESECSKLPLDLQMLTGDRSSIRYLSKCYNSPYFRITDILNILFYRDLRIHFPFYENTKKMFVIRIYKVI